MLGKETIKKVLARIKDHFRSKKAWKEHAKFMTSVADDKLHKFVGKLEELEQNKLYYIVVPAESVANFKQLLYHAKTKMKWTIPNILILTEPFEKITQEKLDALQKKIKESKEAKQ